MLLSSLLLLSYAGELIPADIMAVAAKNGGDDEFDKMVSGKWLPRLQLMTSNSNKCKSGEFPVNHYALTVGSSLMDLGKEVDILVCGMRYKALDTSGDQILSVYDPQSPEFAKIQDKADNTKDSGCMYGPEFLVWVPASKKFSTFLMGSKSSRKVAPDVRARVGSAATLGSQMAKTASYQWMVTNCKPCNTPFDMPDMTALKDELVKFANPPAQEVEAAPADASGRER